MSFCKASGLAIFAVVCLLSETTGSAHTQCNPLVVACATEWSDGGVIDLGGRPASIVNAINDAGQAVGAIIGEGGFLAVKWSGGSVIDLGRLPGHDEASGVRSGRSVRYRICPLRKYTTRVYSQQFLACPCG